MGTIVRPQFLNVLRVCGVPISIGLIAPRPAAILKGQNANLEETRRVDSAAGEEASLIVESAGLIDQRERI